VTRRRKELSLHRIVILVIGTLVMIAFAVGGALRPWVRMSRRADLNGAESRTGIATVTARFGANSNVIGDSIKPWAQVRFHGKLFPAREAVDIEKLRDGDEARITYRIGKSGRTYVDRVEPLE